MYGYILESIDDMIACLNDLIYCMNLRGIKLPRTLNIIMFPDSYDEDMAMEDIYALSELLGDKLYLN